DLYSSVISRPPDSAALAPLRRCNYTSYGARARRRSATGYRLAPAGGLLLHLNGHPVSAHRRNALFTTANPMTRGHDGSVVYREARTPTPNQQTAMKARILQPSTRPDFTWDPTDLWPSSIIPLPPTARPRAALCHR